MSAADHDRFQDDVGAYLLGALEDRERSDFERHVAVCHVCHDEVEQLRTAADALPRSVEQYEPRAAFKRSLMKEVYAGIPAGAAKPRRPLGERLGIARVFRRPELAIVATAFVLTVGVASGWAISKAGSSGSGDSRPTTRTVAAQVDPSRVGNGRATVILAGDGGPGHIRVTSMPAPGAGEIYEIWLKRGNDYEPGPLFSVDRNGNGIGAVPADLSGVNQIMVTRERATGVQRPTEAPLISAGI